MSTKKMARTTIEGGRREEYKIERQESLKQERQNGRLKIIDCQDWDNLALPKRRASTMWPGEQFRDKLNPMERWLHSMVGKSWNKVYSIMRKKFDVRTTPGRHIVFDHLLGMVAKDLELRPYARYYVDRQGVLRYQSPAKRNSTQNWREIYQERTKILNWLQGRRIDWVGEQLYWFDPTQLPSDLTIDWHPDQPKYQQITFSRRVSFSKLWMVSHRQGLPLSEKDLDVFYSFTEYNQDLILKIE